MQTYLPFPDFAESLACLDDKRLNRQRSDVRQILDACKEAPPEDGKEHGAIAQWRGNELELINFGVRACLEWKIRGNPDATTQIILGYRKYFTGHDELPEWFGNPSVHLAHQSMLLRLAPSHFREYFPDAPDDLPMVWPRSQRAVKRSPQERELAALKRRVDRLDRNMLEAKYNLYKAELMYDINAETWRPLDENDKDNKSLFVRYHEEERARATDDHADRVADSVS